MCNHRRRPKDAAAVLCADILSDSVQIHAIPFHLAPHFRRDRIQIQQNGNAVIVPQWEAGGGFLARCCTHRKIPCCQIAAAIFPKTALVTPHAAVVDLNDIPHWCRGFLKECKVHIVIIQLCTQKQWTDNHTPSSCLIGKFHGVRHFSRSRFFYGKIKK